MSRQARRRQAAFARARLDNLDRGAARFFGAGQEKHADGVRPGRRQFDAAGGEIGAEKIVGDGEQKPGTVAGFGVGADRAAMNEIFENLDGVFDDFVRGRAAHVGDESDAARVMLEFAPVQPARFHKKRARQNAGGRRNIGIISSANGLQTCHYTRSRGDGL